MPWSKTNLPSAASKLKGHEVDIFVAAANSALKQYKDDARAIRTGLAAVNEYRKKKSIMKANEVDAEVPSILKALHIKINDRDVEDEGLLHRMYASIVNYFSEKEYVKEWMAECEKDAEECMAKSGMIEESFTQKSLDQELKQATFIVLEPDAVDLHGDTYSAEEIRKACHDFNKFCRKAYLNHQVETDKIDFVESYITPDDVVINDFFVRKGTWLAVAQFNDDDLWQEMKSDPNIGVSIAAYAKVEELQ